MAVMIHSFQLKANVSILTLMTVKFHVYYVQHLSLACKNAKIANYVPNLMTIHPVTVEKLHSRLQIQSLGSTNKRDSAKIFHCKPRNFNLAWLIEKRSG